MAKAAADTNGAQKMVPADCVSVLLMTLNNTSISKAQYNMMSALDGTRTASSFEHQFRSITVKAKELKQRQDDGESFEPVKPGVKRGGTSNPVTPKTTTTPKKRKGADKSSSDDGDDTPSRKKATPKRRGKKAPVDEEVSENEFDFDAGFAEGMAGYIKNEEGWENDF